MSNEYFSEYFSDYKTYDGEYILGIGHEQFINPVKWRLYVQPFEILSNDFEKKFEEFKNGHEFS